MSYIVKYSSQFKKDLKLAKKQNKNIDKLKQVVNKLANSIPLEDKYRNHQLIGNLKDYWECHIEPNWILIYRYYNNELILLLYRVGSHAQLLKK